MKLQKKNYHLLKIIKIAAIFIIFSAVNLYSNNVGNTDSIKIKLPKIPDINFNDISNKDYNVKLTFNNKEMAEGSIQLRLSSITVYVEKKRVQINISQISSIVIKSWKGYKRGDSAHIFYPIVFEISLSDKNKYIAYNVPGLLKILFKQNISQKYVYSYFYDYWKNNKWQNSGSSILSYPETNPHPQTLVQIDFLK